MAADSDLAFPVTRNAGDYHIEGLSKREYFAGLAMCGIMTNSHLVGTSGGEAWIAKTAVETADALLAELKKEHSK